MTTEDDDPIADLLSRYRAQESERQIVQEPIEPDQPIEPDEPIDAIEPRRAIGRVRSGIEVIVTTAFLGAALAAVVVVTVTLLVLAATNLRG
jgi:hypothetical protein